MKSHSCSSSGGFLFSPRTPIPEDSSTVAAKAFSNLRLSAGAFSNRGSSARHSVEINVETASGTANTATARRSVSNSLRTPSMQFSRCSSRAKKPLLAIKSSSKFASVSTTRRTYSCGRLLIAGTRRVAVACPSARRLILTTRRLFKPENK
eukprot:scaffold14006_cov114-Isochrysis_galbana.AAC.6